MDKHTFIGKRKVASTDICDFTDYQGIGRDPLYKRYESVLSILKKSVSSDYIHFLSAPDYSEQEDSINWYIDQWTETPAILASLSGDKATKYQAIKKDTIAHFKNAVGNLSGEELQIMACALKHIDDEFIFCCDGKVFVIAWGMTPDPHKHTSKGELIHESPTAIKYTLSFNAGEHGDLASAMDASFTMPEDSILTDSDIPAVNPHEGYVFDGWEPNPHGMKVESNLSFDATYRPAVAPPPVPPVPPTPPVPQDAVCRFNAGDHGVLNGVSEIFKPLGSQLSPAEIPTVTPHKGYLFKGWDIDPTGWSVDGNVTFNAMYEKALPWYKKIWGWLTGHGCLKWLLWALLALLCILLFSWLFKGCRGCSRAGGDIDPIDRIVTVAGDTLDNNGYVTPIGLHDGRLPQEEAIVAPVRDENGSLPPIQREPGVPPVIADRLILFLENESDNIDALAADFKKAYPGDQYSIIGYDREVKSLVIQIPANERDEIRSTINSRIPDHDFIVFDEAIYELNGHSSSTANSSPGWHLMAVKAQEGWNITKGSSSVTVAVIDDGLDASHPMFQGRIVAPYNVYTQNSQLSAGVGHGTHTAGLAVGSLEYLDKGAAGIAPECKLMPIQVIDNNMCPMSALVSGIMYAVHKNADVVNISIGPSFQGLNQLPVEAQDQIARTQFKNTEKLWNRVCRLAADRNTILVFAAGNDDIISSIPPENRSNVAITVGAVDQKLYPTDFTNYGPCTDISAPGKEIYSAFPVKDFKSYDGTSMAAPIVAGAVALMKSLKKDLTVEQARNVLYRTGCDVYGNMPPMVQVNLALEAVKKGDFTAPTRRMMPSVPQTPTQGDIEIPSSWIEPAQGAVIGERDGTVAVIGTDPVTIGGSPAPDGSGAAEPSTGDETDYDAIRRLIAKYKQKISELEGQLPENKR